MNPTLRTVLLGALGVALILAVAWNRPATGKEESAGASPTRYTVVSTDGVHLIVTDNQANRLFFYSIDQEAQVGDELKLRGYADLTQVGKPAIKPVTLSKRKP